MHLRESIASAKLLTEKLYRRNPRELKKSDLPTAEAGVARAFDPAHGWRFAELSNQRGIDALQLAFRADFAGDRVFAFGVGVGSMIAQAYDDKIEVLLTDSLDAQRLYNAARNLEIAAWKLANARGPNGELLLLSNEMTSGAPNLSFEREFGKLIAYQDTLALVMAQRTNRTIRRVSPGSRDGGVPAALTVRSNPRAAESPRSGLRRRQVVAVVEVAKREELDVDVGRKSPASAALVVHKVFEIAAARARLAPFLARCDSRHAGTSWPTPGAARSAAGSRASRLSTESRRLTVVVFCRRMRGLRRQGLGQGWRARRQRLARA